jgi:hypothetical protein
MRGQRQFKDRIQELNWLHTVCGDSRNIQRALNELKKKNAPGEDELLKQGKFMTVSFCCFFSK